MNDVAASAAPPSSPTHMVPVQANAPVTFPHMLLLQNLPPDATARDVRLLFTFFHSRPTLVSPAPFAFGLTNWWIQFGDPEDVFIAANVLHRRPFDPAINTQVVMFCQVVACNAMEVVGGFAEDAMSSCFEMDATSNNNNTPVSMQTLAPVFTPQMNPYENDDAYVMQGDPVRPQFAMTSMMPQVTVPMSATNNKQEEQQCQTLSFDPAQGRSTTKNDGQQNRWNAWVPTSLIVERNSDSVNAHGKYHRSPIRRQVLGGVKGQACPSQYQQQQQKQKQQVVPDQVGSIYPPCDTLFLFRFQELEPKILLGEILQFAPCSVVNAVFKLDKHGNPMAFLQFVSVDQAISGMILIKSLHPALKCAFAKNSLFKRHV